MVTSPREDSSASRSRQGVALFIVAVLLNYPWERVQSQLYVSPSGTAIPWWLCVAASLVDGLFLLFVLWVGLVLWGDRVWILHPGMRGYLLMVIAGVLFSVGVEWTTVSVMRWWTYGDRMPLVPGLRIGVAPLAQMLVLPPVIFFLIARWSRWAPGSQTGGG